MEHSGRVLLSGSGKLMSGHLGVGGGGGVETHDCRVFFRVSGFRVLKPD